MKRLVALVLSLSLALSLTACGGNKEANGNADTPVSADKMFNISMSSTYVGFNPLKVNDTVSGMINCQFYETLYKIQKDASYENVLAEEAPVFSEDGMTATIKLREGINFQDGTPFNAEAVKYTVEKIGDPEYGSSRASLVSSIDSIEIVDDYTIKFNLKYPDAVLQAKFSHSSSSIISPTADQKQDLMVDPCGTGPYTLVSSISGASVVVTRNDAYWGEAPAIKDATFTVILEESTAVGRLQTGETDYMSGVSADAHERVSKLEGVTLGEADTSIVSLALLRPNSYVNPLMENKEFRTAIVKAIDRDGFLEYVLNGRGTPAKSIVAKDVFGYTEKAEEANIAYDPEGAKKIIADNGWQDEKITILCAASPAYLPQGEYYQANLKDAGFTNVVLETTDWGTYISESTLDNRYDVTILNWSNSIRDSSEIFGTNFQSDISARSRINSDEIDDLLQQAKETAVQEERLAILEKINMTIMEEAWCFPAYYGKSYYASSNNYKNAETWVNAMFYLANVEPA